MALLASPRFLPADTVHLTNGAAIDGMVTGRHEGYLIVAIGNVGIMKISVDEVKTIEKNSRTGYLDPERAGKPTITKLPAPGSTAPGVPSPVAETEDTTTATAADRNNGGAVPNTELSPELEKQIREWATELTRPKVTARTRAERRLLEVAVQAVPEVSRLADHPYDRTRAAVFRILKHAKDVRGVEACLTGMQDTDKFVRKLAWDAIREISGRNYFFPWDETGREEQRKSALDRWRTWWAREQERIQQEGPAMRSPSDNVAPPAAESGSAQSAKNG
jgi:hypothetical protein